MEIALIFGYTFLFLFIIRRAWFFRVEGIPANWVSIVFVLKVIAGCALGLIYTYYYTDRTTADTFKFYDDSKIIFAQLTGDTKAFFKMLTGIGANDPALDVYYSRMNAWNNKDVLFNDNKTIIRLNVIFNLFSLSYYYVNVVFINFISFTGLMALFKLFQTYQKEKSAELFAGVMLLPSMLFWGSGLLKDGLLLFAMGMLLYSIKRILNAEASVKKIVAVILSLSLLVFTKLYVILIIFPGLIAWYWSRVDNWRAALIKFTAVYAVYFFIAFNIGAVVPRFDVTDLIYWKQRNFLVLADMTQAKSVINTPPLDDNVWSIIKNSPKAVLNVLTRPTLMEASSPLIMMSAVENVLLLLLMIFCIVFSSRYGKVPAGLFLFSCFFVFLMFDLIGLITPILGAMVRYKVPALPFLMFVFISIYDREKVKRVFRLSAKYS